MKKKTIIIIVGLAIAIATIAGWYFGFYKPQKDQRASQETRERMILGMTLQQYKYIFGSDENVYQKCQQITSEKNKGILTTQDIERRGPDCQCAMVFVKKTVYKFVSENINDALNARFDEEKFKIGADNLKKQSDTLIEIGLDGCQMR